MKSAYIQLGFGNHITIITNCVIRPNFKVAGAFQDDTLMLKFSKILMRELVIELETFVPLKKNVLRMNRKAFINSIYWFSAGD